MPRIEGILIRLLQEAHGNLQNHQGTNFFELIGFLIPILITSQLRYVCLTLAKTSCKLMIKRHKTSSVIFVRPVLSKVIWVKPASDFNPLQGVGNGARTRISKVSAGLMTDTQAAVPAKPQTSTEY
ncbi:hypothetical protein PoB_006734200 [Plakobranchus ocellatus]|uniref:Uncharacterized protein n=1 Tax=Plakobranchus ocellatus TaxID=259542 RepID=A0AAV4D9X1_9GAST|nr:hypothetical protein PoB_006734200 [Plakobranchus ocellatus]